MTSLPEPVDPPPPLELGPFELGPSRPAPPPPSPGPGLGPAATGRSASPRPPAAPRRVRRRPAIAPPPSAERALAARAAEVARAVAGGTIPATWRLPGFGRDVDLARRQLGPLHDRRMLAVSFEREGSRLAALRRLALDPTAAPAPLGPVEVAYAVRWLELADDGVPLPGWADWAGTEGRPRG